ncbi:unnamed protein product [Didymodactylos carnosus]|uniref:Uncharacterized protein n=1 Tax=Didymodactylos carnosus TaxID=1234261 RepID=A0A815V1H1_9BILA|nr:unnamed protein product [Didymodactylos carnosus]CAF1523430.1 unnamed protein product [Didymodactylos carnosus]CAF4290554.1 unnamed protein product [Didymodactylos carnosus]CAF4382542.1 unnamed protein product [Didymodactylos carnosus]
MTTQRDKSLAATSLKLDKNESKRKDCIQSKPPLSLQQHVRAGSKNQSSSFKGLYMRPTKRQSSSQLIKIDTTWKPSGVYKSVQVDEDDESKSKQFRTSTTESILLNSRSDPEFKRSNNKGISWKPAGPPKRQPVRYFDQPSLRWSNKEVIESMPDILRMRNAPMRRSPDKKNDEKDRLKQRS